jgi:hypothetical protein
MERGETWTNRVAIGLSKIITSDFLLFQKGSFIIFHTDMTESLLTTNKVSFFFLICFAKSQHAFDTLKLYNVLMQATVITQWNNYLDGHNSHGVREKRRSKLIRLKQKYL